MPKKISIFDELNIFKRKPQKYKTYVYIDENIDSKLDKISKITKYNRSDVISELIDKFNMEIIKKGK